MAVSIIDMGEISKIFRKKTKQVLKQASSLSLLCFRLESPSSLSLPTYMRWSSPFIILMALCWALSSMCIPLFYWGRQIQAHGSRCVLTSGKERGRITCRAYTQAIFQVILLSRTEPRTEICHKLLTFNWSQTSDPSLSPSFNSPHCLLLHPILHQLAYEDLMEDSVKGLREACMGNIHSLPFIYQSCHKEGDQVVKRLHLHLLHVTGINGPSQPCRSKGSSPSCCSLDPPSRSAVRQEWPLLFSSPQTLLPVVLIDGRLWFCHDISQLLKHLWLHIVRIY